MDRYTIYCTEEQTKKALNLGAPLHIGEGKGTTFCRLKNYHTYQRCVIPTAEQMIGWLEDKGIYIDIINCYDVVQNYTISSVAFNPKGYTDKKLPYPSRKEATLTAIDAALECMKT